MDVRFIKVTWCIVTRNLFYRNFYPFVFKSDVTWGTVKLDTLDYLVLNSSWPVLTNLFYTFSCCVDVSLSEPSSISADWMFAIIVQSFLDLLSIFCCGSWTFVASWPNESITCQLLFTQIEAHLHVESPHLQKISKPSPHFWWEVFVRLSISWRGQPVDCSTCLMNACDHVP